MSTIDRSKFKATSLKAQEEKDKEVEYLTKNQNNGGFNRLTLEDGTNKFRVYPGNPNVEGSTTMESKVVNFLPYDKPEKNDAGEFIKDKQGNLVTKRTVKGIFNSKVHGGLKHDLVESYIEIGNKIAKENFETEAEQKKYLFPIYGNGKTVKGIQPKTTSVVHADKQKSNGAFDFGEFEFTKAVKIGYNKIAAAESVNDPLGSDSCFTDIEEGRLLIVIKDSKAEKPQDYYNVSIDSEKETVQLANGQKAQVLKTYPLTDDQLERFLSATPLINYRTCFKRRDFELQLKGLEIFDTENGLNIFDSDEFKEIVQLIDAELPTEEEEKNSEQKAETEKEESNDPYAFLDTYNKVELKKFIADEELDIVVKIVDNENTIRTKIREAIDLLEQSEDKTETKEDLAQITSEPEVEKTEEKVAEEVSETTAETKSERLAKLRKKMSEGK